MSLLTLCQQLQNSTLGTSIRESSYAFPIIETTHVLALSVAIGTIIWFDLRLVGLTFRATPVSTVFRAVFPWMLVGFTTMFITGGLLFTAHAADCYNSIFFRIKVALLIAAGLNLATFHLTIDRRRHEWETQLVPPMQARVAGALSLVLWFGVITAGRFTAYNL